MSASENVEEAKDHVKSAIRNLSAIVVDECWGTDDFSKERLEELSEIMQRLIEVRREL